MTLFIDLRTELEPLVIKRCICMDWCTFQTILDNLMDRWFMVFEKPPYNNRRCLCISLENYGQSLFYITISSTLTLVNSMGWVVVPQRIEKILGVTHFYVLILLSRRHNPPTEHPPIEESINQTQTSISTWTHSLV
jgi:hypothetical protein